MTHINGNTLLPHILVFSDPRDNAVSFSSQAGYVRAAQRAGAHVVQIVSDGTGSQHHHLVPQAFQGLQRCLKGEGLEQIKIAMEVPALLKLVPPAATP
jgi:hypothetical protein